MSDLRPLNITGKRFCEIIGIAYNNELLRELRSLNLVSFFKVGKKYLYHHEDVLKVNDMLRSCKISINTDKGNYYITLNDEFNNERISNKPKTITEDEYYKVKFDEWFKKKMYAPQQ